KARKEKADKVKNLGFAINLPGKALDLHVQGDYAWIAESGHVIKKIDLKARKTVQVYRGHSAPVTCVELYRAATDSGVKQLVVSGSWDKATTIKIWNTETKEPLSTVQAHDDFVKTLFSLPAANLLISSGSDKIVRFWDMSNVGKGQPPKSMGSISAHTRPVECIQGEAHSDSTVTLITGDTMGIIKVWKLEKTSDAEPLWKSTLEDTLDHHRTRINGLYYGSGFLLTASADETVQIIHYPATSGVKDPPPIALPQPVRAILPMAQTVLEESYLAVAFGDIIRLYDIAHPDEPEVVGEVDGHWHDVTALKLWIQVSEDDKGNKRIEPWIVSASLDGTIRKWRLGGTLPPHPTEAVLQPEPSGDAQDPSKLTEEEERELAELME
ncbi:WD40 repeat-like protein, partial [Coniophora puteana RWD-64-598 SS2]